MMGHSLLSKEEEVELLSNRQDPKAREKLILSNLRLVKKITRKFSQSPDIFNEGVVGLIEAIDRFRPEEGTRLSTYAIHWIRCRCFDWILGNYSIIKMPVATDKKKIFFQIGRARDALLKAGKEASVEALALKMGVKENEVEEMLIRMKQDVWLDRPIGSEDDSVTLGDLLKGPSIEEQILSAEKEDISHSITFEFSQTLNPKEQIVLDERILQEKILKDVASELNLTSERVRQIEESVRSKLVLFLNKKRLKGLA